MNPKARLLRWHLGLGDALVCNALVRVLIERGEYLKLPCRAANLDSVRAMFSDLADRLQLFIVRRDTELEPDCIAIGCQASPRWTRGTRCAAQGWCARPECQARPYGLSFWDSAIYQQLGLDPALKWSGFRLPFPLPPPRPVARFIHDDPARGFRIPLAGYRPPITGNLFDHLPELLGAEEIHVIDSCFLNLIDLLPARAIAGRIHFHRYARRNTPPKLLKPWIELRLPPLH